MTAVVKLPRSTRSLVWKIERLPFTIITFKHMDHFGAEPTPSLV